MSIHPIVRQIIDRDCHVSMSGSDVVRHVLSKLRNGYATFRSLSKADRRQLIADCLQSHHNNWQLYATVMGGSTSTNGLKRGGDGDPPSTLSGRDVVSLMRKHKRTIKGLAFQLGTTQKRVRQIRERGLESALAVRDWLQAITGNDPGPIPDKFAIRHHTEEAECNFCGCPLYVGDEAYEYVSDVFCSVTCCRHARGWK